MNADVCWRMLVYADVCWRMLVYIPDMPHRQQRTAQKLRVQGLKLLVYEALSC
jgi:hypothetical protein